MQCLLSDNENCAKPLSYSNGFCEGYENGHSAISFIGALQIPVSTLAIFVKHNLYFDLHFHPSCTSIHFVAKG